MDHAESTVSLGVRHHDTVVHLSALDVDVLSPHEYEHGDNRRVHPMPTQRSHSVASGSFKDSALDHLQRAIQLGHWRVRRRTGAHGSRKGAQHSPRFSANADKGNPLGDGEEILYLLI